MQSKNKLRQHPKASPLFAQKITSVDGLKQVIDSSAFIGLDTEYGSYKCSYHLHQVGFAYMATLSMGIDSSRDSLEHFASRKNISSTTFSIAPREGDNYHQPLRRLHRFGNDHKLSHNQLDESLGNLMKNYKARAAADGKRNLVLVLFEYPAEWAFLVQFPSILPYFSEWLDVRNLAHELAPKGVTPGLCNMLKCLGYSRFDIRPKPDKLAGSGNAHNAGNDAVLTLAALENLLVPSNQIKLQFKQKCHQIASPFETPDLSRLPFTANIEALDRKPLPRALCCAAKVAQFFLNHYSPIRTGVRRSPCTERDQPEQAREVISAWIAFKTLDDLNCFVRETQHTTISGRVLKIDSLYNPNSNEDRISNSQKEALRQERANRRVEAEKFDLGDLLIPW
ncbi:hypothetical protein F4680DRAFT_464138 [Xylaria scruposa]|nr:hypothetical protein F4680DRAFT_464138 [Xylaria scruposa]